MRHGVASRLFNLLAMSSHTGIQERFRQLALTGESESLEPLVPLSMRYVGSDASESCNSSKSAIEIRPSRKRDARWSIIGPGGGFLIFGIPVLLVEHDPLQFFGETAHFAFVFCALQTIQAKMKARSRNTSSAGWPT